MNNAKVGGGGALKILRGDAAIFNYATVDVPLLPVQGLKFETTVQL